MNTGGLSKGCLHIGDTVLFSTPLRNGIGYVYKELSSASYNFMTVFPTNDQYPDFPNVAFAMFKVLARNKYQKKQELKNLEEKQYRHLQEHQSSDVLEEIEEDLLIYARKDVEDERLENELEQQKKYGTKVVYGDFIQLQHFASNKFMTANSEASITEGNHLLVNLFEENSEGAVFKILPRYKVKSVGDEVHYDDQIKLESIKAPGQFLHTSSFDRSLQSAGISINMNHHELNLSANESSLQLICYSPYWNSPFGVSLWLKAGDCIRFFHKQDECYVVAEGSFAEANKISENVHCRQRHVDQRRTSHLPSSANTFWQIEKEQLRNSTSVIYWRERCRIKHLPTRLYLAVCKLEDDENSWQVTLKEDGHDDVDTLFSFHPLIQEGSDVLLESYALIQHCSSRRWLHLDKTEKGKYVKKTSHSNDCSLKGLQWDSAELYKISTSKEKLDYDAFTVQEVSADLIENFNYVAGIVPIFSNHLQELERLNESVPIKNANTVIDSLKELSNWMITDNTRETKNRQKLLRNLRVLAQIIEMLKELKEYTSSVHHYRILCRHCYTLLTKYLSGDSRKNENYLAQFIEFFQTQVHKGLNAEDLLVEIVQDNLSIVSRMAQTQMCEMIKEFRKTKDYRFLDFLSSLCVCSGHPIPSTQDRLLQELDLKMDDELFIRTRVTHDKSSGKDFVECYRPYSSYYIEISEMEETFSSGAVTTAEMGKADYDIFVAQLHLFARLCKGNNKTSINLLAHPKNEEGFISFKEAILCAQNTNLSFKLRSRYVELILVMFVDVDENMAFLDNLIYSFIYDDISENPYENTTGSGGEITALTQENNVHFPVLKQWLQNTLIDAKVSCTEQKAEENYYLADAINVLAYLVRYGYYDDMADVDECMKYLIILLEGNNDRFQSCANTDDSVCSERWRIDCPANRPVFAIKAKVLEVLSLFYKFKFYVKLQKYIYDFKVLNGSGRRKIGSSSSPPAKLGQFLLTVENEMFLHSKDMMTAAKNHLKILCKDSQLSALHDHTLKPTVDLLIDLSCYESEKLNNLSLHLLLQMHYFEDDLFEKAKQTQLLISDESIRDYSKVKVLLPKLRHLLRVDPDQKTQDDMIEILDILCSLCILVLGSDEPNSENQIMLDNFGIVSDILSYVLAKGLAGLGMAAVPGSPEVGKEVYKKCFCLLKNLVADNKKIQAFLFGRVDDLLQIKTTDENIDILADLADLLTEVFTGGPDLVLRIRESQIERIFEIIVHCKNPSIQAQFMLTLQALAKIEELNLPVKRNQEMIIKNFCRLRGEFCKDVLGEQLTHKRIRAHILHFPERTGNDPRLLVLLSATDMLAACAEGKNLFIESVCQNIFSLEELIDTIGSQLPPLRKRPFIRFLIWVYMKTADDKDENRKSTLKHGNVMWNYLEKVANFLENISSVLRLVPMDERSTIRQEFKEVLRPRTRTSAFSIKRPKLRSNSSGIPNMIGEEGSINPGLLEFLVDGVIPLLHTYYMYFFNPSDGPTESRKISEIHISAQIFNKLMLLQSVLANFFDVNSQVEMFQNTIRCFKRFPEVVERASISVEDIDSILNMSLVFPESSQPMNYQKQRELNKRFHRYSTNYSVSYKGPNIAQHQIGYNAINKKYSDPGEELPLGPHFQNLIRLYFQNKAEESSNETKVRYEAEYILYQLEVSRCRTVRLSEAEQERQDTLDIRCLQLLRGLIHNQIKLLDPEEKDRNPEKFREKSLILFVPVQNQIQSFGSNGIQKLIPLLSHAKPTIAQEALALIKAMLFSGNILVQTGIALNSRETREETLFLNLKRMLETSSQNYKDMRALQKQLFEESIDMALRIPSKLQQQSPGKKSLASTNKRRSQIKHEVHISLDTLNIEVFNFYNMKHKADVTEELENSQQDDLNSILLNDNNWITLVLEVIGLMCDGQHKTLQNYLRDQPDNFKTANVVAEVANFLHTYTRDLIGSDLKQINQILQTLIEMCVGNPKNQQVIFDTVVIEPLNRLLELSNNGTHNQCTKECYACQYLLLLIKVKGSVVELLEVMLEETTKETAVIAEGIGYTINVKAVIETLNVFHKLQSLPLVKEQEMDDDCERGMFKASNILSCLSSHKALSSGHSDQDKIKEWKEKEATFAKCIEKSVEIEIHYEYENEEPVLARVQFPFSQEDELRKDVKETARWSINRDSMDDKHRALLSLMPSIKADIRRQKYLRTKLYWRPCISFHPQRHYLLLFLTFLLNIFILFLYKAPSVPDHNHTPFIPDVQSWFLYLLYILGSIHTLLSFWMVIEYFVINWPHFRLPKFVYKIPTKLKKIIKHDRNSLKHSSSSHESTCLDVNVFGVMTIYMIVFLVCSILSLVYFKGFFYPICLLYIIVNNDILQRVLRAVTKNGDSLIFVAILGLIVLFIYAVISFAFLHNFFIPTDAAELYCSNLAQCMYSILRFGLLDNIGLLIPLNSTGVPPQFEYAGHFGRLIFDISFFIIVVTIGLNVVFGIIVDTFSQLREERSNVLEDEKSTCFVCNLPSHEFDRKGNGFKRHIIKEHNMWNYVYYSVYLDSIDTGDHNAIQKYVHEKINANDASFFPQDEAKCLANDIDSANTVMSDLISKVNLLLNHFDQKAQQKSETEKQKAQERWDSEITRRP